MRAAVDWMCYFQKSLPPSVVVHWYYESQFWNDEVERTISESEQDNNVNLNLVQSDTPTGKKYDRILKLQTYYQNGRIYYNQNKKSHKSTQIGLTQLYGIEPGYTTHDDAPDADEQCITKLSKYIPRGRGATKPKTARYERKHSF
jgi:hypothetical protein